MKKYIFIACITFALYVPSYSQGLINFQGKQYEQKNNRWYDKYGNIVNDKIVTIKLKNSSQQPASLENRK